MDEEKKRETVQPLDAGQLEKVTGGADFAIWGDRAKQNYRNDCNECGASWSSNARPDKCCKCGSVNIKVHQRI